MKRQPKVLAVIPSRIGSSRLPRKPLLTLAGKTMIERVYEGARSCEHFAKVVVATDSDEIAQVVTRAGGEAVMTSPHHQTGSDRVAEVALGYPEMDVIVNLQGDEPFVTAKMLSQLVAPFYEVNPPMMSTLAFPLSYENDYHTSDIVKVICDKNMDAIYFSRSPIPYFRAERSADLPVYHHMGMYAFQRDFLKIYTKLEQTPLEKVEVLEQLRALENGYKIRVCLTESKTIEINTPDELLRAQKLAETFFSK